MPAAKYFAGQSRGGKSTDSVRILPGKAVDSHLALNTEQLQQPVTHVMLPREIWRAVGQRGGVTVFVSNTCLRRWRTCDCRHRSQFSAGLETTAPKRSAALAR